MTTTMAAVPRTLLSCPFCGGTCIFTEPDERGSGGQWVAPIHVGCNDCKAEQMADTVDEAVERWNRRSAAPGVSTVEDERQAFEAWAEDQGFVLDCDFFEVSGQYYDQDDTQLAYDIWRAARASVAAPAAGDALTGSAPEWATCESRGPWARNSLKAAIDLLREKETRARHAYTKDYMGLPARYIADAYGEAAAVVERKLGAIAAQRKGDA